jgi:hypothetical protein
MAVFGQIFQSDIVDLFCLSGFQSSHPEQSLTCVWCRGIRAGIVIGLWTRGPRGQKTHLTFLQRCCYRVKSSLMLRSVKWWILYGVFDGSFVMSVDICQSTHFFLKLPPVLLVQCYSNLFCSRTPTYNFSSTLYPQSCWCIIQVIHSL